MRSAYRSVSFLSVLPVLLLVAGSVSLTHCKKFEVSQVVIVKTEGVSEIAIQSCKVAGTLVAVGSSGVDDHGFCWSLTTNPADAIDCSRLGSEEERVSFSTVIQELTPGTLYYFWAYGSVEGVRTYGDLGEFATLPAQQPDVETGDISSITTSSAQCEGNVISNGGSSVSARGVCWSKEPLPNLTTAENHSENGDGTGTFTGSLSDLTPDSHYYVRAWATNEVDTNYGNQKEFDTPSTPMLPEVATQNVKGLSEYSAIVGGSVTHAGFAQIDAKGIFWSLDPDPGADDNILHGGSGEDAFELTLEGLSSSTVYYYRAFAENSVGIGVGDALEFKTLFVPGDVFIDARDGQSYPTVQIGDQCWMAKNMNIGMQIDTSAQQQNNVEIEKYCYNNNGANCNEYGGLYTWDEMMQYSDAESAQGVCPNEWHIPSDGEWIELERHLGIEEADLFTEGYRGYNQGGMLKLAEAPPWEDPNTLASNITGFSALPAGMIYSGSSASTSMGYFTVLWVSSAVDEEYAYYRILHTEEGGIGRLAGYRPNTTSVRCIRD